MKGNDAARRCLSRETRNAGVIHRSIRRPAAPGGAPASSLTSPSTFSAPCFLCLSRIGHGAITDLRDRFVDSHRASARSDLGTGHRGTPCLRPRALLCRPLRRDRPAEGRERRSSSNGNGAPSCSSARSRICSALLNAVDEPALNFVTGSVIADERGPFVRSVLINLGRDHGVRVGYAVINGDGLVGRTVDVGTSVVAHPPAQRPQQPHPRAGRACWRARAGFGRQQRRAPIRVPARRRVDLPGDEVYTSGSDGVLPRGLTRRRGERTRKAPSGYPYAELRRSML